MRKKYDSAKEAIETEKEYTYKYALIYLMSEVYLGENNRSDLPFDEILEARFFDESGELFIMKRTVGIEVKSGMMKKKIPKFIRRFIL